MDDPLSPSPVGSKAEPFSAGQPKSESECEISSSSYLLAYYVSGQNLNSTLWSAGTDFEKEESRSTPVETTSRRSAFIALIYCTSSLQSSRMQPSRDAAWRLPRVAALHSAWCCLYRSAIMELPVA